MHYFALTNKLIELIHIHIFYFSDLMIFISAGTKITVYNILTNPIQIKAAVSINGLPFLSGIPMSYQGTSIGLSKYVHYLLSNNF